jgi:uncharacterized protein YegL
MSEPQSIQIPGTNFGFSAVDFEDLGASEYTVVCIAVDVSSSVYTWTKELRSCVKAVVEACRNSPRSDNLLLRVLAFNAQLQEIHGYKELGAISAADYDSLSPRGTTALFDAAIDAIGSCAEYGKKLVAEDFDCNGVVFVITDGEDNSSGYNASKIGSVADEARRDEMGLESLLTILIGVGAGGGSTLNQYLQQVNTEGRFDQYVPMADASPKALAKLADFVSQSISSQSQALGTNGPSQTINPQTLAI